MAGTSNGSLRIVNSGTTQINPTGYIGLTTDFMALTEPEIDGLKNNENAISFLKQYPREVIDKTDRIIDKSTNKVKFMRDEDIDEDRKIRTHVSIPSGPYPFTDISYLDTYVGIIKSLSGDEARKFLFGVMLITRCR